MTAAADIAGRAVDHDIQVLTRHRPGAEITTVSVWILAGARDETTPGTAHLFEHLVMQAVPPGRTMRVIDEIESYGGEGNAITARDYVVLYARVPTVDALPVLDLLAEAATVTEFDPVLIEAERRVVLEELRLAEADPTDIVHDVFFAAVYGDHPMGRPVGGAPADVLRLTAADVAAWSRRHLQAGRVAVVVTGGVTPAAVTAATARSALAGLSVPHQRARTVRPATEPLPLPPPLPFPLPSTAAGVPARRLDHPLPGDTAVVVLGGPAFALADPRLAAAEVVMELFAGGNTSVLVERLRTDLGLSYDIWGDLSGYADTGVWRIAITTAIEHRDEVARLAADLIRSAVADGWSDARVAVARRRAAGLVRLDAETSLDETLLLGRHALLGGSAGWSVAEYADRIAAAAPQQVHDAAVSMADQLVVATAGG
ncbi:putative Zn-dependent peptidase [Micromonospora sp. Llam0]|uniref:M16 family metallopeptidase n=1 Tax=Micromonospora sp. Llam0 TaxID=2485143 RepID=UPI000F4957A2|nr:pitrilysin family protein [Micromonospora sp. Llam0]ROO63354.1 putative Zn-dependent peptidase [Micromonospora sp. Llam0]